MRYRADKDETLRYLGYAGQDMDAGLAAHVEEGMRRCEDLSRPAFVYATFPVRLERDGVCLDGSGLVLAGKDIRRHLDGARECAVLACTLGLSNERELRRLQHVDAADALVFSAAGSSLVESVAQACETDIASEAHERGLYANVRYSPGYGDLPLELQAGIVRVLGADKALGLSVGESCLLTPVKSVTAFIGLFDEPCADVRRSCDACLRRACCDYRRDGSRCWR